MTRAASLRAREEDGITTYHREKPLYADCLSGVWHLLHMQKEAERDYRPTRKINVFPALCTLQEKNAFIFRQVKILFSDICNCIEFQH